MGRPRDWQIVGNIDFLATFYDCCLPFLSHTYLQESLDVNHLLVFVSKTEKRKRKKYGHGQRRCGEQGESIVSPAVKTKEFFYLPLKMEEMVELKTCQ